MVRLVGITKIIIDPNTYRTKVNDGAVLSNTLTSHLFKGRPALLVRYRTSPTLNTQLSV